LTEKYGQMSVPVISHYLKTNEDKQKTSEREIFANKRHSYPLQLVSNETMTFDPETLLKMEKYVGLIVNKYTGKGQPFRQFIKDFECIAEPISEGMYYHLIWHFIDAKEKEKVQIINLKEIKTETFLAQLFLAYELCPPTQTAINKKLEQLDTTPMNIVETYNAIIRICGELPRGLEHLLD